LETVCSGPALEGFYSSLGGASIPLREIAVRADQGKEKAVATITRLRVKFAEALGAVVNLLDPDAVVIGGGVGNIDTLYSQESRDAVSSHLFNDRFDTPLLRPQLGDSAGVFGAAMLTSDTSPS
jgi:N-acetylglucosamine kinase